MAPISRSLVALASFAMVSGVWSLPHQGKTWNWWKSRSTPALPLDEISNTGATPLPTPTKDPKYIILGLGYQNYTCGPSSTYVQAAPTAGAVADLYDITKLVTSKTSDFYTKASLRAFEKCTRITRCTPSLANGYCNQCHDIAAAAFDSNYVGQHYFDQINGAQSPNFDIAKYGDFFSGKRGGGAKAPEKAYDGQNGLGAIDWLYLVDNASGRTKGLKAVYRVETAGGVAPGNCGLQGEALQIPYATEYWFYD